jgi:hypothetical protein
MENYASIKNSTSNSNELAGGRRRERERETEKNTQILRTYHSLGHADFAQ